VWTLRGKDIASKAELDGSLDPPGVLATTKVGYILWVKSAKVPLGADGHQTSTCYVLKYRSSLGVLVPGVLKTIKFGTVRGAPEAEPEDWRVAKPCCGDQTEGDERG